MTSSRSAARAGARGLLRVVAVAAVSAAACGALCGCGSRALQMTAVRTALVNGQPDSALAAFDGASHKKNDLLYLLEKGYLSHIASRWDESNDAFERAELRAEELYTKSLSREAAALLTSDLVLPYRGMPYELQMVQYYRAINYLQLGQAEEALVEARKANETLARYAESVADDAKDETPRQDAFLQYVTGLLYESEGEANDAAVSFREAARLYDEDEAAFGVRPPSWLVEDLYSVAQHLDLDLGASALVEDDADLPNRAAAHEDANLVVFFESGFVPYRESVDITLPIFGDVKKGDDDAQSVGPARWYVDQYCGDVYSYRADRVTLDHVLRFAFPQLVDVPSAVSAEELVLPGGESARAERALDLSAVAHAEFDRRLPKILLKTVARAIAKEAVRKKAKKEDKVLGWIVNTINVVTEQADTRGWIFLPGRIDLVKAHVPEGEHTLEVRFRDGAGVIVEEGRLQVTIEKGRTTFASIRTYR